MFIRVHPWLKFLQTNRIAIAVLLFVAVSGVYLHSLKNGFINLDDPAFVYSNAHVQRGLSADGVRWAFTTMERGFWHPLTWLSLMLDAQLYALKPWGFHLTSLFIHALTTALLFLVFQRMTGAIWRSAFVAALFGLHPLHVESVAWVSERKDVLSGSFWVLTMLAYARFAKLQTPTSNFQRRSETQGSKNPRETGANAGVHSSSEPPFSGPSMLFRGNWRWYLLALVLFALGLMCKSMLVTLPLVLLLLDFWPLNRLSLVTESNQGSGGKLERQWELPTSKVEHPTSDLEAREPSSFASLASVELLLFEKLPFFGLALVFSVLTFLAQREAGAVQGIVKLPMGTRVGNAILSYLHYLAQMFVPRNLAAFYSYPKGIPVGLVAGVAVILGLITAFCLWQWRRRPYLLVGWAWYVITLLPVIGIVQVGSQAHADRYTYLPLIGIFLMLTWLVADAGMKLQTAKSKLQGSGKKLQAPTSNIQRSLKTKRSNNPQEPENGVGVHSSSLMVSAGSPPVVLYVLFCGCLAVLAACSFLTWQQIGYWHDSETLFRHALAVTSNNEVAHNNLGTALFRSRRVDEALMHFQEAVRLKPDYVVARANLGSALLMKGRVDEAINQLRQAVQMAPSYPGSQKMLGVALGVKGAQDEALAHLEKAVKLDPGDADGHYNLGVALMNKNRFAEAAAEFQTVLRLKPGNQSAKQNLQTALTALSHAPAGQPRINTNKH